MYFHIDDDDFPMYQYPGVPVWCMQYSTCMSSMHNAAIRAMHNAECTPTGDGIRIEMLINIPNPITHARAVFLFESMKDPCCMHGGARDRGCVRG